MKHISSLLKKKFELQIAVILLLFVFLISTYSQTESGIHITDRFYDVIRDTSTRGDIVIVGIDDKSLQAIGAWPFDRTIFANFHKSLLKQSPRAVAYDVLFLEPRAGDEAFEKALTNSKITVALASKYSNNKYLESFFVSGAPIISGLVNVPTDRDGKVRKIAKGFLDGNTCHETLSYALFKLVNPFVSSCVSSPGFFRYSEPKIISFVDVLNNEGDLSSIPNSYVFIGSDSLDLPDHFVGLGGNKIPGVTVHSSILNSLLNGDIDSNIPTFFTYILILLSVLLSASVVFYFKRLHLIIITFFSIILIEIILAVILFNNHFIIPIPWMLLGSIVSLVTIIAWRSIRDRKQNEYIRNIFGKYVHDDVLKELLKDGSSVDLGGVKKRLTILFSDLRGFTTLSEQMQPEELTVLLNGYFSVMSPIVLNKKGTIDKYIGDAIMAFWNAPLSVENHETLAVEASLDMIDELAIFNKENSASLKIGVGVHVGEVVVGNFGSKERINYTALGDNVNLTSRLEGLTKKYNLNILVTGEAMENCNKENIVFRKVDIITVKGKKVPTEIYEPLRRSEVALKTVSAYDLAFQKYVNGDFDEALELFEAKVLSSDGPTILMKERIKLLKANPQDKWNGVYEWEEK